MEAPSRAPTRRRRALLGVLLTVSLIWIGLVAGTALGSRLVPEGSGMAGPAIALGYGVLAAAVGLLVGLLLSWLVPPRPLRPVAVGAGLLSLLIAGGLLWRVLSLQKGASETAGADGPMPSAEALSLEASLCPHERVRPFRELAINGREWAVEWVAVGPEAAHCRARMTPADARALLGALESIEARLANGDPPCPGATCYEFSWRRAPPSGGDGARFLAARGDATCLNSEPAVAALRHLLGRLPIDAVSEGRADCEL